MVFERYLSYLSYKLIMWESENAIVWRENLEENKETCVLNQVF